VGRPMNKRTTLSVGSLAAIAAMIATPGLAADMAPPALPAPSYNWTGFYVGGHAGYGWQGDPTVSYTPNDAAANVFTCGGIGGGTCVPPAAFGISGGLIGIQAGYNLE
jgi:outer membrane immunogenic protein